MSRTATDKYLHSYAEPEVRQLQDWPAHGRLAYGRVVPAFVESPEFLQRLLANTLPDHRALAIIVVNRPDSVASCEQNQRLMDVVAAELPALWRNPAGSLSLHGDGRCGVLLVDRHNRPIPARQGVGLARKLGADLAAALVHRGQIDSPWIHSSDADAHWPPAYLRQSDALAADSAAACYAFSHRDDGSDIALATRYYELHLRNYTEGLRRAGSPYAFYTIGSILAFHCRAYCQARGFPKRAGGEDFYLLNKLAKLGRVEALSACVELQPRLSRRVPFGTGPASARILEQLQQGEPCRSYNPQVFIELKHWLSAAGNYLRHSAGTAIAGDPLLHLDLHPASRVALQTLGIDTCWRHLNQSTDGAWRVQHFHHWFDAFRTLKFIHALECNRFPPQPLPPLPGPRGTSI